MVGGSTRCDWEIVTLERESLGVEYMKLNDMLGVNLNKKFR